MSLLSFLTKTELVKEQDALAGREEITFSPEFTTLIKTNTQ